MNLGNTDWHEFVLSMVALIICITIHEFAHAFSAVRAGDDTPRLQGRISLNPLDHLDPVGTIMMVLSSLSGFGIGWGKPVQVNPANFRHPRWDNLRVSLWGPLSNILTALVVGLILRAMVPALHAHPSETMVNVVTFLAMLTMISIGLAVFNLLPIGPLDGGHILSALLPIDLAKRYDYFMARYGLMVFLGLVMFGSQFLHRIMGPPRDFLWSLFTGIN